MQASKPSKIKLGTITKYNTVYIVMIVVCTTTVLTYTIFCLLDLYACCDIPIFNNDTDEIADADLNSALETDRTRPILTVTLYPLTLSSPYIINNPAICTNVTDLKYIVIVHTATDNFQRRRLMRNTWANKNLFKSVNSRIVFFLGLTKNKNTQMWIENESVVYGDIVQGNFLDTYRNLTHKGVLSFRWISVHCRQAEMIVKIDDDIFVNPFILLRNFQPKMANMQRHIMCHYRKVGTSRIFRTRSKWTVDKDKFKGYINYPFPYCDGFLVLMSPDMILALYRAASFTPFFWVDDVYLFGILPAMIGNVTYQNIQSLTWRGNRGVKCYTKRKTCDYLAVNILKDTDAEDVWFAGLKMTSPLERKDINMDYVLVTNAIISSDSTYSRKFRGSKL